MFSTLPDLAKRALHTFWQAFVAALGVTWAASGIDVSQITDIAAVKKVGLALVLAVVAAALSALKTTIASSGVIDVSNGMGAGTTQPYPVIDTPPVLTPADPSQPAAGVPPTAP